MKKLYICNIECLDDLSLYNKAYRNLSKSRKLKLSKYRNDLEKKLCMGAELLLKYALSNQGYINFKDELDYKFNSYGKPYLKNININFNLSHSGNYCVCVLDDSEIGVDVQLMEDIKTDVAKRFFHPNEYEYLNLFKNNKQAFYRLWTLKEAFIKCIGGGLNIALNSFEIKISNKVDVIQKINKNKYYFREFDYDNHHIGICEMNDDDFELELVDLKNIFK